LAALAVYAFAQDKPMPSPEIDRALRDRAAQYMQFMVDKAYSKAYQLVAEESHDWYFSSSRPQYTRFKIEGIEYAQGLERAIVKSRVTRVLSMNGHDMPSEIVVEDLWKLEGGKWMWYHDPEVLETVFGPVRIHRDPDNGSPTVLVPTNPEDLATKGQMRITGEARVDKTSLPFQQGVEGSGEVLFHNGYPGVVTISVDIVGDYRSFTVQPVSADVPSGQDLVVKVAYKQIGTVLKSMLRIRVAPLNKTLTVPLDWDDTKTDTK